MMFSLGRLLLSVIVSTTCFALWKLFHFVYHQFTSPLRHLRGPESSSLMYGNIGEIRGTVDRPKLFEEWQRKYGNTMRYNGFFNRNQLLTLDTRALNHVLTHSNDYPKQPGSRYLLRLIVGEGKRIPRGLLVVEGTQHRQQRRIMNPAFGLAQIRALTSVFLDKAIQLCDLWTSEIAKASTAANTGARIDVLPWLSRMTLDIIGLAGFNYDFGTLKADGERNELQDAYLTMFSDHQTMTILPVLQMFIPPFRLISTERTRKLEAARRTMTRIGKELVTAARAAAQVNASGKGGNASEERDLLSLLVKANVATDTSQRLSEDDILSQIPTFLVAGHDTTSTAVTWALYAMTQAPDVQRKLRKELLSVDTVTPSMDDLMRLPYLDAVLRETLRVYPPIPVTSRVATKDDMLPVEKPFVDKYGVVHDGIRVSKGDPILIQILALNHSKELWGPDAHEFRPERWSDVNEAVSQVPGVWSNLLTFLGGPRACIGYRFSVVEIKAILFILLRTFEFALAVPASEIASKAAIVQRPVLRSDPKNEPQLPLLIRPYTPESMGDS